MPNSVTTGAGAKLRLHLAQRLGRPGVVDEADRAAVRARRSRDGGSASCVIAGKVGYANVHPLRLDQPQRLGRRRSACCVTSVGARRACARAAGRPGPCGTSAAGSRSARRATSSQRSAAAIAGAHERLVGEHAALRLRRRARRVHHHRLAADPDAPPRQVHLLGAARRPRPRRTRRRSTNPAGDALAEQDQVPEGGRPLGRRLGEQRCESRRAPRSGRSSTIATHARVVRARSASSSAL